MGRTLPQRLGGWEGGLPTEGLNVSKIQVIKYARGGALMNIPCQSLLDAGKHRKNMLSHRTRRGSLGSNAGSSTS